MTPGRGLISKTKVIDAKYFNATKKGEAMCPKKIKETYLSAEFEVTLFEFSDIVTTSGYNDWKPDINGNTDPNGWS